jgi:hypothetical protein
LTDVDVDVLDLHIAIPDGAATYVQPSGLECYSSVRGTTHYDWWRDDSGTLTLHRRRWLAVKEDQ